MTWLISLVMGWGVPAKFAKPLLIGAGALLLLLAIFAAVKIHDHRVIAASQQKAQLQTEKQERKADANLQSQVTTDTAAAVVRKQEIDNATRTIPDQAPSARQRATACVELRRQATERRQPQPAC